MHTTPWFHATDLPNVPAENLVQIGIGGWQAPRPGVAVGRERNTTIMTVTDCVEMGIEAAAERALEVAWKGAEAVWLSFDVDCLDAAFVPGTGWPEPGGFLPREVLKFIQLIVGAAPGRHRGRRMLASLRQRGDHRPDRHPGHLRHPRLPGAGRAPAQARAPDLPALPTLQPLTGRTMAIDLELSVPPAAGGIDILTTSRRSATARSCTAASGRLPSFAAGFSFVSILTTVFQLFAFGFSFGGPAFVWTWPIVFVGQFSVALVFAELSSRYPVSGSIYQWSRRISNGRRVVRRLVHADRLHRQRLGHRHRPADGAAVGVDGLPAGVRQLGAHDESGATNAIIIGSIVIVISTIIGNIGVGIMSRITRIGVTCELVGVVLLIVLFFSTPSGVRPRCSTPTASAGHGSYLWPFLISALMACYVMYGFDSAGELSEETRNPRKAAPQGIIRAMLASGVGGAFLLVGALLAAPSCCRPSSGPRASPISSRAGSAPGWARCS